MPAPKRRKLDDKQFEPRQGKEPEDANAGLGLEKRNLAWNLEKTETKNG